MNKKILEKILDDKLLEIERGCDGAWVAHPGLINPIKELFIEKLHLKIKFFFFLEYEKETSLK